MSLFGLTKSRIPAPDKGRFHAFYQDTVNPLAAHLRRIGLRNDAELEDVLQETYIEAMKGFHQLKDTDAALSWLLTIGRRVFFRSLRTKNKPGCANATAEAEIMIADDGIAPADEYMHASRLCREVLTAIRDIVDPVKKKAVTMFFLEEESLTNISSETGVKISTLTTWMNRFREKTKKTLNEFTLECEVKPVREAKMIQGGRILT